MRAALFQMLLSVIEKNGKEPRTAAVIDLELRGDYSTAVEQYDALIAEFDAKESVDAHAYALAVK